MCRQSRRTRTACRQGRALLRGRSSSPALSGALPNGVQRLNLLLARAPALGQLPLQLVHEPAFPVGQPLAALLAVFEHGRVLVSPGSHASIPSTHHACPQWWHLYWSSSQPPHELSHSRMLTACTP